LRHVRRIIAFYVTLIAFIHSFAVLPRSRLFSESCLPDTFLLISYVMLYVHHACKTIQVLYAYLHLYVDFRKICPVKQLSMIVIQISWYHATQLGQWFLRLIRYLWPWAPIHPSLSYTSTATYTYNVTLETFSSLKGRSGV
jgi:hypothetical protein